MLGNHVDGTHCWMRRVQGELERIVLIIQHYFTDSQSIALVLRCLQQAKTFWVLLAKNRSLCLNHSEEQQDSTVFSFAYCSEFS